MLNKKWIAGAVLAAFLTVGVGTGTTQAYASERVPAAVKISSADTVELGRHHRDHHPPKHVDRHRGHGSKHIDHRDRGPRHHEPPPRHRSHDSGSSIVGGIIGGIIGGILVNSSD